MRIAIVNDLLIAVEAMRRVVASAPAHQVAWIARDGREAVERCAIDRPDLILMDLIMPKMDGVELIRQVRGDAEFTDLPVVAMSAFGEENLAQAWAAGANETIAKPFEPDELFKALLKVLPKEHGH